MHPDAEKAIRGLLKAVEGLPPATELMMSIMTILRLCAREAKPVKDDAGEPAVLYECGPVTLLCVMGDATSGSQRVDGFYISDDEAHEDDKVREERLSSSDRLFSLIDRHGQPPHLDIWKDPSDWFADVRACVLMKIAMAEGGKPDEVVGHA